MSTEKVQQFLLLCSIYYLVCKARKLMGGEWEGLGGPERLAVKLTLTNLIHYSFMGGSHRHRNCGRNRKKKKNTESLCKRPKVFFINSRYCGEAHQTSQLQIYCNAITEGHMYSILCYFQFPFGIISMACNGYRRLYAYTSL